MEFNSIYSDDWAQQLNFKESVKHRFSPIVAQDQELYHGYFYNKHGLSYAYNWSYIIQACRNLGQLGYKYHYRDTLISIGLHRQHFLVVSPSGRQVESVLSELLPILFEYSNLPVFVKHLSSDVAKSLTPKLNLRPLNDYPWETDAINDDATFPEVIIKLKDLTGPRIEKAQFAKIRLRLNRFSNVCPGEDLSLIPFNPLTHPEHYHCALNVVSEWCGHNDSIVDVYRNMLAFPAGNSYDYLLKFNHRIVGIFMMGALNETAVGAYINICNHKQTPGLSESGHVLLFNHLYDHHGIRWCNLGGSEHYSLHKFKMKFKPHMLRKVDYLVYGY